MPVTNQPNVVLCLFDSLSYDALAAAICGVPGGSLSTISRLCSKSVCFCRAYTPCPESSPARASLFTGLDPVVHGLWTNGVALPNHEKTFAQSLAQAGYANYLAGRYQLSGVSRWTTEPVRQGEFRQMDWAHGPLHRSRQNAYLAWLQHTSPDYYSRFFAVQADPDITTTTQHQREALNELPEHLSFNRWVGNSVAEWVESQSFDQPLMAVAGFCVGDMHGAEPHPATDIECLNAVSLKQADAAIGRIMECLKHTNRAHDTVVIITAARGNLAAFDAGCSLAEQALKEQAIRVPLIIHGADYKAQSLNGLVSTIDIAPTVLAIANVPCTPRMQGKSLLSALNGAAISTDWGLSRIRQCLPSGERNWQTAFYTNNSKLVVCHNGKPTECTQMFKLDTDPLELNNLADQDSHAFQLEELMDQMIDARCALEDRTEPRIAQF